MDNLVSGTLRTGNAILFQYHSTGTEMASNGSLVLTRSSLHIVRLDVPWPRIFHYKHASDRDRQETPIPMDLS
jgi:hypothetical protein